MAGREAGADKPVPRSLHDVLTVPMLGTGTRRSSGKLNQQKQSWMLLEKTNYKTHPKSAVPTAGASELEEVGRKEMKSHV
ncbi:hypothetical protein MC885_015204 [Smutsia gigantea]|nr:hypothetical protein MC885_015204 [Smutsia gigantea]